MFYRSAFDRFCDALGVATVGTTIVATAIAFVLWQTALPFIGLMYLMGVLR